MQPELDILREPEASSEDERYCQMSLELDRVDRSLCTMSKFRNRELPSCLCMYVIHMYIYEFNNDYHVVAEWEWLRN